MKRLLICTALLALACVRAQAREQTQGKALFYTIPSSYDSATYEGSSLNGMYAYYGYGADRAYELGADFSEIDYASGLEYKQQDYTLVYNGFRPGRSERYGVHHITSSTGTYDGTVYFAGASGVRPGGKTWNANLYLSSYSAMSPSLTAVQISVGSGSDKPRAAGKGMFVLTQVHAIRLGSDIGTLDSEALFSVEVSASRYGPDNTLTVFAWAGEQAFGVQNSGFAVFNKPELQKGAYGASVDFSIGDNSSLKLGYSRQLFEETLTGDNASASKYTLMLGREF